MDEPMLQWRARPVSTRQNGFASPLSICTDMRGRLPQRHRTTDSECDPRSE